MKLFGRWPLTKPIRLIEACGGLLLLGAATLWWENAGSAAYFYFLGALLPFLTLHSYLEQGRPGR